MSDSQTTVMTPKAQFQAGVRDMTPFLISGIPIAIIGGAYGVASGLGWWKTLLLAMAVNSGTVQFVATKLLHAGASAPVLWLTALVLCLRLVFYAMILRPHVWSLPKRWQILMGFGLIDAIFFLAKKRLEDENQRPYWYWYFLGGSGVMYAVWISSTLLGTMIGSSLTVYADSGLDFPMTALFAAMLGSTLVDWKTGITCLVAGLVALLCKDMPYGTGLIVAVLAGAAVGYGAKAIESSLPLKSSEVQP
jgi:4-azaleucine resistance transporter AzlC